MTTTKQTHEYLNMTSEEYESYLIEIWLRWCMNLAGKNEEHLQSILANRSIRNYYNDQFQEVHHSFMVKAKKIHQVLDFKKVRQEFVYELEGLYNAYPGALIEQAKKLKIENPPYAN